MQLIRKIVLSLLSVAIACTLLAGCNGGGAAGSTATTATLPTAKFTYVTNGLSVAFNGSSSINADGTTPAFAWNFGDGGTSTIATPIHVYAAAQSYTVILTITDEYGNSASNQQKVSVTASNAVGLEPWTWVADSNTGNPKGSYGTEGTPSDSNAPGGRQGAVNWTDAQGRLWLFGGIGYDSTTAFGLLNDLWRFDPGTGQWTWVNGSPTLNASGNYDSLGKPTAANMPGARSNAVQWTDTSGNFWLFGGTGYDSTGTSGNLNDLWKFNSNAGQPTTGQWTWVAGSNLVNAVGSYGIQNTASLANVPRARSYATSWTDKSGKLWLFGGQALNADGTAGVALNDLWVFDPASNLWTWVGGSSTASNEAGAYGSHGVGSTANIPGARLAAQSWTDTSGNLWLFGGGGYDSAGNVGVLNDMWSFSPDTGVWTWVAGSNLAGAAGVVGTEGTPAEGLTPSARLETVGWTDAAGMLWLFGGGASSTGAGSGGSELSDLWKFNPNVGQPTTGQWTWVGGVSTADSQGVYSAKGVTSLYNAPGARVSGSAWVDTSGTFWLFGGAGVDSAGNTGDLNDLW
ncbi:MAG: kelch repeat-containing protein, partial [Burkholderiales bacterium]